MRREHQRIQDAGATVGAVVMGSPLTAGRFRDDRSIPYRVLADPDRAAYTAFGLSTAGASKWITSRKVLLGAARLYRRGVASGLPHPGQDIRQMPGTFVVSASGVIRYAHYSDDAADVPVVEAVLAALGV